MIVFNIWFAGIAILVVILSGLLKDYTDASFIIALAAGVGLDLLFRSLHKQRENLTWRQALFGANWGATLFWIVPFWTIPAAFGIFMGSVTLALYMLPKPESPLVNRPSRPAASRTAGAAVSDAPMASPSAATTPGPGGSGTIVEIQGERASLQVPPEWTLGPAGDLGKAKTFRIKGGSLVVLKGGSPLTAKDIGSESKSTFTAKGWKREKELADFEIVTMPTGKKAIFVVFKDWDGSFTSYECYYESAQGWCLFYVLKGPGSDKQKANVLNVMKTFRGN